MMRISDVPIMKEAREKKTCSRRVRGIAAKKT